MRHSIEDKVDQIGIDIFSRVVRIIVVLFLEELHIQRTDTHWLLAGLNLQYLWLKENWQWNSYSKVPVLLKFIVVEFVKGKPQRETAGVKLK